MLKHLFVLSVIVAYCYGFGQFHMKKYTPPVDSDEEATNSVLRTYRRCLWEQSKSLPRRLVLLSLCQNLFCENNHVVARSRSLFVVEKMARPNE